MTETTPRDLFCRQLADGPGRPVVVSHALGLDHTMWEDWASTQAGKRPVLAYDQRGHGRSALWGQVTMHALVDDAQRLVDGWQRGPVVWLGLSMGGMVGQGLALTHPGLVRGLVVAHSAAVYPPAGRAAWAQRIDAVTQGGMEAVADLVVQRYLHENFRNAHPGTAARLRQQIVANDPRAYTAGCAAIAAVDWLDALPSITCPTLVLAGALDVGATPAMARDIHERIPGSSLHILDDASHLSTVEQPAAFKRVVGNFLRVLDGNGRE